MDQGLKRTPLYEEHVTLGAKMVPFAGYEMPVQYPNGINAEHRAVREGAGLFDVSHMGEFDVSGHQALELIQRVGTNDASRLEVGQAQYSALCKSDGCLLDDLLVYRLQDRWMLVVNASNREKDLAEILEQAEGLDVQVVDRSDQMGLLALQGPRASEILQPLTETDLDAIRYYRFAEGSVEGCPAIISRTGYTGEDGFELYVDAGDMVGLWRRLLASGDVVPAGLGARDSLRLEVGFALYGNDLDEQHTALESGLGWIVKLQKERFQGRDALAREKEAGPAQRLVGLVLSERGFPRPGYEIVADGEVVGRVTSGTSSPTLGVGIAMGYVPTELAKAGTVLAIRIRNNDVPAEVTRPPFFKDGSVRR